MKKKLNHTFLSSSSSFGCTVISIALGMIRAVNFFSIAVTSLKRNVS